MESTAVPNRRYVAILSLVACLILLAGWFARPREIPESPAPVPTESELEQLARRSERRTLDTASKYFAGIARDAESSIAYLPAADASGLKWDAARIVTSVDPPGARPLVSAVSVVDDPLGLAPARRAATAPGGGDWIVAVWRTDAAPGFTVGTFAHAEPAVCAGTGVRELVSNIVLTRRMMGGGLFNIDGALAAIILPCGNRMAAIDLASVQALLDRKQSPEGQLLDRFGVALSPLTDVEAQYFKTQSGLLVREVWIGRPADTTGLRPGDIVTSAGGAPLATRDGLASRAAANATLELTVLRGTRRLTLTLAAAAGAPPEPANDLGVTIAAPANDYLIESVRAGSRAAQAGLEAGDRIVGLDRAPPRNADQIRRTIERGAGRPIWIEFIRDGRRLGALAR